MVDMSVKIGNVTLKNPIMPASGCFSTDMAQVIDLNRLGALVAKTVSREFRAGNPPPRVSEVEGGMINSIGLPTKGIEYFLSHQVPDYKRFTPPLVGSISATTIEDFEAMARDVSKSEIDVLEVNISCPTRDPKGGNFALHEEHTFNVMSLIRKTTDKPIWCKLSPNAGDVVAIAKAAEAAGATRWSCRTRFSASRSISTPSARRSATSSAASRGPASSRSSCAWSISAPRR